jgi:malonyl CoA-acyl carrier protein transacylase
MLLEELKILAIDEVISVIEEVNGAVNRQLEKSVSNQSRNRVISGSNLMSVSTINTLRLIQKQLLEQLASKSYMA